MYLSTFLSASLILSSFSFVAASPAPVGLDLAPTPVFPNLVPRQTIIPGGRPCGQNNETNRRCWKNNWNITTDYEKSWPPAFTTRRVRRLTTWLMLQGLQLTGSSTKLSLPI